jgi:hypothetical protein
MRRDSDDRSSIMCFHRAVVVEEVGPAPPPKGAAPDLKRRPVVWAASIGGLIVSLPAILVIVLAWAAPYPNIPLYRDSSTYAYLGVEILHGKLPIRDIFEQRPGGIAWLNAAAFLVSPPDQRTLFWLDILFSVCVVLAATWAVSSVAGRLPAAAALVWGALFFRLPYVFDGGNLTEQYAMLPAFLALGASVRALKSTPDRRARWAVFAGCAAGAAALFKPTAGTAAPALILALLVGLIQTADATYRRAAIVCVASAAAVVILAVIGYLVVGTSPADLYADVVVYNSKYPPAIGLATIQAANDSLIQHRQVLIPLVAVLLGVVTELWGRRQLAVATLIVAAMGMDVAALVAPGFFYNHYYMLLTPSFTMGLAWALGGLAPLVARLPAVARASKFRWELAITLVLGLELATYFPVAHLFKVDSFKALASGSPIPLADGPTVLAVQHLCRAGQPIYVWGNEPEIYFESGDPSSSRYIYLAPLQMPGYDNQRRITQLINDLAASPPCVVVDASNGNATVPPLDDVQRAQWQPPDDHRFAYVGLDRLYEYVNSHYQFEESAGPYRVLVPRLAPTTATGPVNP